jgi:hypothetical protein
MFDLCGAMSEKQSENKAISDRSKTISDQRSLERKAINDRSLDTCN